MSHLSACGCGKSKLVFRRNDTHTWVECLGCGGSGEKGLSPHDAFRQWNVLGRVQSGLEAAACDKNHPFGLTPDMERVLGMPLFVAAPYAHAFQAAGINIPPRPEAEQAAIIFWMLKKVLAGKSYDDALASLTETAKEMTAKAKQDRNDKRVEAIKKLKQKWAHSSNEKGGQ